MAAMFGIPGNASAQVTLSHIDRAIVIQSNSAASSKKAPCLKASIEKNRLGVLLTVSDQTDIAALESAGLEITGRIGKCIYGKVSVDNIDSVAACDGVEALSIAKTVKPLNDMARISGSVDAVQEGTDQLRAYTGAGVITGITDIGLDPNHIAFKNADGKSRIMRLWNYASRIPQSYNNNNVLNFTTDDNEETHGTHVLATIAGSCDVTDNGNDYHGVAPDADIAVMCGSSSQDNLLSGIERMIEYAESQGKPLVINMSLGDNFGPHDGTDPFPAALDELAAKVPIFLASGNEGTADISLVKEIPEESATVKTLFSSTAMTTEYYGSYGASYFSQGVGYIDVWSEDETPFEVYLDLISASDPDTPLYTLKLSETPAYVGAGSAYRNFLSSRPETVEEFSNCYNNGFMGGYTEINKANGRFNATMAVFLEAKSSSFYRNFVSLRIEGKPGQKVFVYADGNGVELTDRGLAGFDRPTADGSISNMACGKNTISVGAYVTRASSGRTAGDICDFSSWGTLHDGRELPDIVAPGSMIVSAMSTPLVNNPDYRYYLADYYPKTDVTTSDNTSYYWTSLEGTSMATPFATGVGALVLEANPNLTPGDIREILKESATEPEFHQVCWGAGKINALDAVKLAIERNEVGSVAGIGEQRIAIAPAGYNCWEIFTPTESGISATVSSLSGITVKESSFTGNSGILDLNSITPGVYVLSIKGEKLLHCEKIAVK